MSTSRTPFDDLDSWSVLTPQDVADRVRIDVRSVRRAITCGALAASRVGGLRVLAGDAAEWWRSRAVLPESTPETPQTPSRRKSAARPAAPAEPAPPARRQTKRTGRFDRSPERLPLPPKSRPS